VGAHEPASVPSFQSICTCFWFPDMAKLAYMKRYAQYCAVARALDLVGERWTLLVVRSLLLGPRRYTDLREGLPGIASDLLTARLRTLEDAGYVRRRRLPRPASVTVYELTDAGWQLGPVVLSLAKLGVAQLGSPSAEDDVDADALVLLLRAGFRAEHASGDVRRCYQLELDGEIYAVQIHDGWVETRRGSTPDPACALRSSARTLAEILSGALPADAAIADGRLQLEGPTGELAAFLATFSFAA